MLELSREKNTSILYMRNRTIPLSHKTIGDINENAIARDFRGCIEKGK